MKYTYSRESLHHHLYLFGLALLVCCLPLSKYMLSIAQFVLALNWVIQGNFKEKVSVLARKPAILLLPAIALLYFVSLIWTDNLAMGFIRSQNTLTMIILPVLIVTSPAISERNTKRLLLLFAAAVIAAAITSIIRYYLQDIQASGNFRQISMFMLHIRFSMMVIMTIFILLYYSFYKGIISANYERILYFVCACMLTLYLFFLRSFTGIIIFAIIGLVSISILAMRSQKILIKSLFLAVPAFLLIVLITTVTLLWLKNFHPKPAPLVGLEEKTVNGNAYTHDTASKILENGNYTDIYLCEPEMAREWNKVSLLLYEGKDLKNQQVNTTLRRYLTSKGLRKDSAGVRQLDSSDIRQIEKGLANHRFRDNPGVYQRLYETLWEIQIWKRTGYVRMHSMGQRLAFLSVAGTVISSNLWTGVGIGDVYDSMLQAARDKNLEIDPQWEGKPHNQFVFFMLAFGIPGFIIILFCLVYPVITGKTYQHFLFTVFAGVMILSMFMLDTLESYFSITFFVFFYTLFVLGAARNDALPSHNASSRVPMGRGDLPAQEVR